MQKALKQIDDTGYAEALHQDGICKILKYAIACYKKTCKIMLEAENVKNKIFTWMTLGEISLL